VFVIASSESQAEQLLFCLARKQSMDGYVLLFIVVTLVATTLLWQYKLHDGDSCGMVRGSTNFRQARPLPVASYSFDQPIPEEWDWRTQGMPVRITEQFGCGSCWAFSSVFALQERLWLATGGRLNKTLSAQYLVNCEVYCEDINDIRTCDEGCNGGLLEHSWLFLVDEGTPTAACQPYKNAVRECQPQQCDPGTNEPFVLYKAQNAYHVTDTAPGTPVEEQVRRIQYEIMTKGPVSVGFDAHEDFKKLRAKHNGIYRWDGKSTSIGPHAARLIGWGTDPEDGPYWILANQFGKRWASDGCCRYPRGENYMKVESNVVAGDPKI
jgi:hypothetical protein